LDLSPFFNTGTMLAVLQSFGTIPMSNESWKFFVSGGAIVLARSLSNLAIQDLAKILSEGKQIDAVLLDFSKAFDKVPHQRLLLKLKLYGIQDNTLQ
jgi:hypothetical protein